MVTDFPRGIIITSVLFGQSKSTYWLCWYRRYVTKVFCCYRKLFHNRSQRTVSLTLWSSCIMSVQYTGGYSVQWVVSWVQWGIPWVQQGCSVHWGYHVYSGGYFEYTRGVDSTLGDIMHTVMIPWAHWRCSVHWRISWVHQGLTMMSGGYHEYTGDFQYTGGYHEYTKGCSVHWEYIMSTLRDVQYTWG